MTSPERASVAELLKQLTEAQERTQKQLADLQREVTASTASQSESSKRVVQKLEEDKFTFKKKGNERQFKFNKIVDNHLDAAMEELQKVPKPTDDKAARALANMEEELKKGRAEIADRQKKIKMADRSEFSWGVVEAYESDDLASDSADEKRIEKAEKEAERRAGKRKRDKKSTRKPVGTEPKRPTTWELANRPGPSRAPPMQPQGTPG